MKWAEIKEEADAWGQTSLERIVMSAGRIKCSVLLQFYESCLADGIFHFYFCIILHGISEAYIELCKHEHDINMPLRDHQWGQGAPSKCNWGASVWLLGFKGSVQRQWEECGIEILPLEENSLLLMNRYKTTCYLIFLSW